MTWCWWCCHTCEEDPLHLPYKYDNKRDKFHTMGIFCSWACMKAFNLDYFPQHKSAVVSSNMLLLKKRTEGDLSAIKIAPSRFTLKEFGGDLDISEFRKICGYSKVPRIKLPCDKLVYEEFKKCESSYTTTVTESESTSETNNNVSEKEKMNQIINSKSKNQPLRLKREKPLKRNVMNLETTLGLSRVKKS